MDFSTYKKLLFRRDGKVLNVTFNRPEQFNAFGPDMGPEVLRFLQEVADDEATNVVVLSGAGKAFSAGGDIDYMEQQLVNPADFRALSERSRRQVFAMLDCPKVLIAKVNGAATGLGASVALLCDMVIAAEHARIGDPHVKVGLVAGDGGALMWPQLIGYARAREYLLSGDLITAAEAARMGLINRCVPADQLDRVVDELAQRIAEGATRAIQHTKAAINIGLKQLAVAVMPAGVAYEDLTAHTIDHAEAVHSFRDKRSAVFIGR